MLVPRRPFSSSKLRKLSRLTSKDNFPPPLPSLVLCKSVSDTARVANRGHVSCRASLQLNHHQKLIWSHQGTCFGLMQLLPVSSRNVYVPSLASSAIFCHHFSQLYIPEAAQGRWGKSFGSPLFLRIAFEKPAALLYPVIFKQSQQYINYSS